MVLPPKANSTKIIRLLADRLQRVARVCLWQILLQKPAIKAARLALHFRNGSHHSPFAER
jgi:hypothetical protein